MLRPGRVASYVSSTALAGACAGHATRILYMLPIVSAGLMPRPARARYGGRARRVELQDACYGSARDAVCIVCLDVYLLRDRSRVATAGPLVTRTRRASLF